MKNINWTDFKIFLIGISAIIFCIIGIFTMMFGMMMFFTELAQINQTIAFGIFLSILGILIIRVSDKCRDIFLKHYNKNN